MRKLLINLIGIFTLFIQQDPLLSLPLHLFALSPPKTRLGLSLPSWRREVSDNSEFTPHPCIPYIKHYTRKIFYIVRHYLKIENVKRRKNGNTRSRVEREPSLSLWWRWQKKISDNVVMEAQDGGNKIFQLCGDYDILKFDLTHLMLTCRYGHVNLLR